MGRSRGGLTTKIHALVDANGLPILLKLTPGQAHDGQSAADMFDGLGQGQILIARESPDVGDQIELFAAQDKFVYAVEDITIVNPSDVTVLRPRPRTSLTLVTCYPFYFLGDAPQRYIVHASLVDKERATASSLNSAVQQKKSEEMP